jgi:hypothetical protein
MVHCSVSAMRANVGAQAQLHQPGLMQRIQSVVRKHASNFIRLTQVQPAAGEGFIRPGMRGSSPLGLTLPTVPVVE